MTEKEKTPKTDPAASGLDPNGDYTTEEIKNALRARADRVYAANAKKKKSKGGK